MKLHNADFGGISYTTGDFHTPGTSGLGEMSRADFGAMGTMGFSLNDAFKSLFGADGATAVKTSLQQAGTTLAMNTAGRVVQQNPEAIAAAQAALASTQKSTMEQLWVDYKTPILIGGALLTAVATLGIYNTFRKR